MADGSMTIASAVMIPEPDERESPTSTSAKRRQSSTLEYDNKRPRLDTTNIDASNNVPTSASPDQLTSATPDTATPQENRRRGRNAPLSKEEERKRGRRLFGSVLGTLAQSSSNPSQKRRQDIENKQRAKLRAEAEKVDEEKKQNKEMIEAARRKEQKVYERKVARTCQENALAMANFLQTEAEPKLYYLPWQLRDDEKGRIQRQLEEIHFRVPDYIMAKRSDEQESLAINMNVNEENDGAHSNNVANNSADPPESINGNDKVGENDVQLATSENAGAANVNVDTTNHITSIPSMQQEQSNEQPEHQDHTTTGEDQTEETEDVLEPETGEDPVIY